ncbi:lipoprotein [Streptomyces sp. WM6372]|uniref:SCO0930 family lipoprotein n=1 Tax=Streptomyces sp. WM6372 TaxID=1415555 RepID=UPI0006AEB6B5|nr:SCO0930 family lipoprotein [Streptomyces sp. WM6372]KOU17663.1 lipoprotein [Streptomyces sp. WM6372]
MRRISSVGSVAAVLLLAAGCGSSDNGAARNANSVQPAGAGKALGGAYDTGYGAGGYGAGAAGSGSGSDVGSGSDSGKAGSAGQLSVRDIASVGSVVTDSAGMALYRFDKDTPQPPKSNCEGDCATTWPAVPAEDASAATGIDAALIGSVARADGSKQLTLGGWPVYRYAKDTKAGEAKGEGVGGTWHALAPDGKKAIDKKQKADGNTGTGTEMGAGMGGMDMKSGAELSVADNEKLGKILVDGQWRTLYRFDKDSAWPMKFGCLGACLDTWKPAPAVDKAKAEGISGKLVGSVKRPDGSEQLTIDCWPVYTFTGDTAPGQANGHNKQGLWFAVTAEGKKVPPTA